MPLESATYINQLVAANPLATDNESQGVAHLNLIKQVLQNTFPNFTGVVILATDSDLSALAGAATTGATLNVVTQPVGNTSTLAASCDFVSQTAFSNALPGQAGKTAGQFLETNGETAYWAPVNANDIAQIAQGII